MPVDDAQERLVFSEPADVLDHKFAISLATPSVNVATCAVMIVLGKSQSGLFSGRGSEPTVSRAAPPISPVFIASTRASSSIRPPRAVYP